MTLEQQFQRQATAFHKLSRRVTGDLKAKQDLGLSLSACMGTISQHLVGLIQRVRALGAKLDDDLQEACRDMEESLSWFQLWLRVLRPIVEAGQAHIGELVSDAGQDVAWPLSSDTSLIPKLHADSETLWAVLVSIAVSGVEGNMSDLFTLMGEMLQRIRLCPAALPGIRQGLVVAIQASMGNLRDPMQYAPATAQEWLYPSLLLEQSCVFQGLVSESFSEEIKKLMALPCPYEGYMPWAVRVGEWVRSACTDTVDWAGVMSIGGYSAWDLPGVEIHGPMQVWHWPEDLNTLAGQCGHLFHEGRRPSVCDAGRAVTFALRRTLNRSESTGPQRPWTLPSLSAGVALWGKPVLFWMSVLLSLPATSGVRQSAESYDDEVAVAPEYDSSPACSHAFAVWTPFHGPSVFDYRRGDSIAGFRILLREAGHREENSLLHVAFDTLATSVDLVSCPSGSQVWWTVRDGLSRELLRPLAPWYAPEGRHVLTLNSLGQAQGVSFSQEAAS
eukprot:s2590_g20.t1